MLESYASDPDHWETGKIHLSRDYLSKWLEENKDFQTASNLNKIIQKPGGDLDTKLFRLIYAFCPNIPFVLLGKRVTLQNLFIYIRKVLQQTAPQAETRLVELLFSGQLKEYIREYEAITGKKDKDLSSLMETMERVWNTGWTLREQMVGMARILRLMCAREEWILPEAYTGMSQDQQIRVLMESGQNFLTRQEIQTLKEKYLLPKLLTEGFEKKTLEEYLKTGEMIRSKKDRFLTVENYQQLQKYCIPSEVSPEKIADLSVEAYMDIVNYLKKPAIPTLEDLKGIAKAFLLPSALLVRLRDVGMKKLQKSH